MKRKMRSEQFEEKIRRLMEAERLLVHQTTADNAVLILEHGLMSSNEAKARGIEVEEGGYPGDGYIPDKVSLTLGFYNCLKEGHFFHFDTSYPHLIIDKKYIPDCEHNRQQGHLIYDGIIAPEDILAMVVCPHTILSSPDSVKLSQYVVELQKQRLQPEQWTPVFLYDIHEDDFKGLYLPEWLEVSDVVKELVEVAEK